MRTLLVLAALSVASPAAAACPWEGPVTSAHATMTTVTINGQTFPVKGKLARSQFVATLNECGVSGAVVQSYMDWRSMRRWTNISAIVGICCFWPALIATPITAIFAGDHKSDMILHLSQE